MTDDWLDALDALLQARARFLIVGAHAMALHGVPRATQDLDLWIEASRENAQRAWRAFASFGAPLSELGVGEADLVRPGTVIQLGLPPNRIDVLTSLSGLENFDDAWQRRVEQVTHGRPLPFIGKADLIANKRATGRTKDLADIEALGGKE
jgi:hypothetical protein